MEQTSRNSPANSLPASGLNCSAEDFVRCFVFSKGGECFDTDGRLLIELYNSPVLQVGQTLTVALEEHISYLLNQQATYYKSGLIEQSAQNTKLKMSALKI